VVEQHCVDALQPLGALVDKRLAESHPGAQVEDVLRRDPGLWQAVLDEQLAQQPGVETVGLGAALAAASRGGLGRLGEMHLRARALQLLNDKAPARHRLDCRDHLFALEAIQEPPQRLAVGRPNATRLDFAAVEIKRIEGDLRAMHIEAKEDRHGYLQLVANGGLIVARAQADTPTCDLSPWYRTRRVAPRLGVGRR
jgi:hypothetical protein